MLGYASHVENPKEPPRTSVRAAYPICKFTPEAIPLLYSAARLSRAEDYQRSAGNGEKTCER
jgi:hypothetical protein